MLADNQYIKDMAGAAVEKRQDGLIDNDELFGFLDSLAKPIPDEIPGSFDDQDNNWKLM